MKLRKTIKLTELKRLGACDKAIEAWPFDNRAVPVAEALEWGDSEDPSWPPWLAAQSLVWAKTYVVMGSDPRACFDHALRQAATNGHLPVVKYLVGQGSAPRACGDYALRRAAANGHLPVVTYLVGQGCDQRACDEALRWAARYGHPAVVKYLKNYLCKEDQNETT